MSTRQRLERRSLPSLLAHLTATLQAAQQRLDDLNVFPVPDGDTGTNLVATVRAGRDAVAHAGLGDDTATSARRALLRGARGNSGVIMSQIVTALVVAMDQPGGVADAATLATMLADASTRSAAAVADPVDGTILTAVEAAAVAARERAGSDDDVATVVAEVLDVVRDTVAATRHQLPANRAAGVVDAGAAGFEVVWEGLLGWLRGAAPPEAPVVDDAARRTGAVSLDGPGHEVMYVVELADPSRREHAVAALREGFLELGDSVVVVGDADLVQAHVHTDHVRAATDLGAAHGDVTDLRVTRFADQVGGCADPPAAALDRDWGVVAVVPGPGLAALVGDLGGVAVHGSSGDLPNVATLLAAVTATRSSEVLVLPGHPNVTPTARQAASVAAGDDGPTIHVLPGADAPARVLAVLLADVGTPPDLDRLTAVARAVRVGEVVPAVRDADLDIGPVRTGQWLAVTGGDVRSAHDSSDDALHAVVDAVADGAELLTLVAGADVVDLSSVGEAVRRRVGERIEVDLVNGGQRPAAWIVGAE